MRVAETIVRLCQRATGIDPGYAQAWALMALAQTSLRFVHGKPDDGLEAAERALSLDPDLASARAIRARHIYREGRQVEAFNEIGIALRLDPESYEVNASAGLLNFRERKFHDAIRYYEKAAALEMAASEPGLLITCYRAIGDREAALRWARTSLARAEKALEADISNGSALGFGAYALATLGEAERARDWIARAMLIDPDNISMRYNFACALCCGLGDTEGALKLLGPYFQVATLGDLNHIEVDTDLDPIRQDPRFGAMLAAARTRLTGVGAP
jgi:adenylate cyclase